MSWRPEPPTATSLREQLAAALCRAIDATIDEAAAAEFYHTDIQSIAGCAVGLAQGHLARRLGRLRTNTWPDTATADEMREIKVIIDAAAVLAIRQPPETRMKQEPPA